MPKSPSSIQDFLEDASFREWVRNPTAATNAYWQGYQQNNPSTLETIKQARQLLQAVDARIDSDFPGETRINELFATIQERNREIPLRPMYGFTWGLAAAASVLLILGLLWWTQVYDSPVPRPQSSASQSLSDFVEKANTTSKTLPVQLPDGSTVLLQKNSRIKYASSFGRADTRDVYLQGGAFFDVLKNPQKPFLVYAQTTVTKVLGTSFWVRAFEGEKKVTIAVRTGKVSVFSQANAAAIRKKSTRDLDEGVVLTPNQQAVYDRTAQKMLKMLVLNPQPLTITHRKQAFRYHDTPVSQVFAELEETYGIRIIYDRETMGHCIVTGDLGNESLFNKLTIICKGIEAQYTLQDAQILITGPGCS